MNHSIIFPCYKPNRRFNELLDSLLSKKNLNIIVVDNGNDDSYKNYFLNIKKKYKCDLVKVKKNIGKGNGIKQGIKYLLDDNQSLDFVLFADSDGQHTSADIIKFLDSFNSTDKNFFFIGKRMHNFKTPLRNRIGNFIFNILINYKYRLGIKDALCGLRAIHYSNINVLMNIDSEQFDFEIESLIKIVKNKKISFKEILVSSTYFKNRKSNFSPIFDSFNVLKCIYKKKDKQINIGDN